MIKAVIFDIDGVLLDSFEANFKFFQDLMGVAGYAPPSREQFAPLFPLTMRDVIATLAPQASEGEVGRIWEMGRTRAVPYPFELLQSPTDMDEVVSALAQKYRLALVTNRVRENIFEAPQLGKLKAFFSAVITYQDTENHKPHPAPLLLAAERLGVAPAEAVYVGDAEVDVQAAHAAGMKIIAFSQNPIPGADAQAKSFKELLKAIDAL